MIQSSRLPLREWASLRSELVWIYEGAPGSRTGLAQRERGNWAWFLSQGGVTLAQPTGKTVLKAGSWLLLPMGKARHEFTEDARLLSVHFRCQWPSGQNLIRGEAPVQFPGTLYPGLETQGRDLERLVRRHLPQAAEYKLQTRQELDGAAFLQVQAAFLNWLALWLEACVGQGADWTRLSTGDDRLLQALRLLNHAPLEQPFPRLAVRKELELSEVHLNRLFLREFGQTTRKYWDRRRLEFAKSCLETSHMPVKEVAYRLGFRSDSHFAVWFRRQTQLRPSEFRESAVENGRV